MGVFSRSVPFRRLYPLLAFLIALGSAQSQSLTERAWIWTTGSSVLTCLANTDCADGLGIYGAVGVYGTQGTRQAKHANSHFFPCSRRHGNHAKLVVPLFSFPKGS